MCPFVRQSVGRSVWAHQRTLQQTDPDACRLEAETRALDGGAHRRHLANANERSVRGGDAALCRITLTACRHYCGERERGV